MSTASSQPPKGTENVGTSVSVPVPSFVSNLKVGGFPLVALRFDERHRKHPVFSQGVFEHLLVTRLEDVDRQESVRKKQRAREWHHRDPVWQRDGLIHGEKIKAVLLRYGVGVVRKLRRLFERPAQIADR